MMAVVDPRHTPRWNMNECENVVRAVTAMKPTYLRSDTMRIELKLITGGESYLVDRAEGGGRGEPLTLRMLRRSDDASDVVRLMGIESPVEVVCQPLDHSREPVGDALVYIGKMNVVRPDLLEPNHSRPSFLTIILDEWTIASRKND